MLEYTLIHPDILSALAGAGHGSRILIADGHYPVSTGVHPRATRVHLNLRPDLPLVTDVLAVLLDAIPIEAALVMAPPLDLVAPEIFTEFHQRLDPLPVPIDGLDRFDFYEAARGADLCLAIATGDRRTYANLLLTIGVRST
jgi:L-fucose mutarotase